MKNTLMKYFAMVAIVAFLFSCQNESQEQTEAVAEEADAVLKNYTVVWLWETNDAALIAENTESIATELNELWEKGLLENAYFNSEEKVVDLADYANITFLLSATSEEAVENILDNLTLVKEQLASYTLYRVGDKALSRIDSVHSGSASYVAVWRTSDDVKPSSEVMKAQAEATSALYDAGLIENVYFDIEGTQKDTTLTDFVFFISADSQVAANELCKKMPFAKERLATYMLRSVGAFTIGAKKNQ